MKVAKFPAKSNLFNFSILDSFPPSRYIASNNNQSLSHTNMVKLIALYRKPNDVELFDKHYYDVHLPLVKKTPGLRKVEITKITGAPIGESKYHLMAELYYDSIDAMNAANGSPEGRAAAKDLMSFAADVVTLFYGEIQE
jgi:uncharacterized protein (TIGR02118 family)